MHVCPSAGQLGAFLDRQLGAAEMEAVLTHVEECASCQTMLEELTSAAPWQPGLLGPAAGDSLPGTNPSFLQAVKKGLPVAGPRDNGALEPAAWPAPPGYEIVGELGRGGMGIVFKARQVQLKRLVALKMVSAWAQARPELLVRFRREAEAVARLQHPNIVQIHEVGDQNGQPFFSLEYVDGGSLAQRLAGAPQPPREAAQLVETLARAMDYAHQHGIIHRDLKPANILLVGQAFQPDASNPVRLENLTYIPKITDFGLAKQLDQDAGQTQASAILGTPSYMAPEQAAGDSKAISPRADVYALGAILYEMLTGRPPFRGESALDTLQLLKVAELVPPRRLQPRVPRDLETICLKCLQKEPRKRYASAAALAADLHCFTSGLPITARPTPWWELVSKWVRRRPATAALTAGIVLLVVSLLSSSLWYNARLESALDDTGKQRDLAKEAANLAERRREQARWTAFVAEINLAERNWVDGRGSQTLSLLERQRPEHPGDIDYRGFEWNYLWRISHGAQRVLRGHAGSVQTVAYSPDGRLLASGSADGTVKIWDVATGKVIDTRQDSGTFLWVGFADKNHLLACNSSQRIWGWDVRAGTVLFSVSMPRHLPFYVACSPDGRRFASIGRDHTVRLWGNIDDPKVRRTIKHPNAECLAFQPDGRRLASAGGDKVIRIWDTATGGQVQSLIGHSGSILALAYTPDGGRLLSVSSDRTIRLWHTAEGRQLTSYPWRDAEHAAFSLDAQHLATSIGSRISVWLKPQNIPGFWGHTSEVRCLAFSPDGRQLATAASDFTVPIWDPQRDLHSLTIPPDDSRFRFAFSPDGKHLATAQLKGLKVWEVVTGRLLHAIQDHPGYVYDVAFSPDGARLACCGQDGTVRVYDPASGKEIYRQNLLVNDGTGKRFPGKLVFGRLGLICAAGAHQTVYILDIDKKCVVHTLTKAGNHLAMHPDGQRLATADADGWLRVWDAASGQELRAFKAHEGGVKSIAYSRDGTRLVSVGFDQTVRVWQPDTGHLLLTLADRNADSVAFSHDGKRLAIAEDFQIRLFDATQGSELITLADVHRVHQVAFSPDGHRLAGLSGWAIKIWDATPLTESTTKTDGKTAPTPK